MTTVTTSSDSFATATQIRRRPIDPCRTQCGDRRDGLAHSRSRPASMFLASCVEDSENRSEIRWTSCSENFTVIVLRPSNWSWESRGAHRFRGKKHASNERGFMGGIKLRGARRGARSSVSIYALVSHSLRGHYCSGVGFPCMQLPEVISLEIGPNGATGENHGCRLPRHKSFREWKLRQLVVKKPCLDWFFLVDQPSYRRYSFTSRPSGPLPQGMHTSGGFAFSASRFPGELRT